ncbi:MAG: tRNA 2-thiouridine(34) synthase MnmA [Lentisphaerae bacterium]|nr:tRNA 2-thiouridine(34) synthase MnmA [Lentisphaerota bacterium]
MSSEKQAVAVGMSGGVDSSVVAWLLKNQGHAVVGLTMSIWDGTTPLPDEGLSGCYGPGEARDIEAARSVAARLGIPHHVIPLAPEYAAEVLDNFRAEYRAGRTPNPCVRCNRAMKFALLLERARAMGIAFDRFATGHYARVERHPDTGRWLLLRAADASKDQTYFLSRLSQEQLARVLFPLGSLTKERVKALARDAGWVDVADKKESQNFIESRNYSVLFDTRDAVPGPIVDTAGRVLGRHQGIVGYTVGQRKGLGLSGTAEPLYVVRIEACANTLVVGGHQDLFSTRLTAADLNWISLSGPPASPLRVTVKIRQQHREAAATLRAGMRDGTPVAEVQFDEPQMSVTPGQTAVFYDGDRVTGSGIIQSVRRPSR